MWTVGRPPNVVAFLQVDGQILIFGIIRSGLKKKDRLAAVLGQSSGHHATGGACPNHYIVIFHA
jgi:hypothetical protein